MGASASLVVVVHGSPAPQGSKRHVGGGRMVEQSRKVAPWRAVVTTQAAAVAAHQGWEPSRTAPAILYAVFTVARPTSHYRTGRHSALLREQAPEHPTARPDLDKLLRSTLDALVDAGALHDDSRVVQVQAAKTYPGGHPDALDSPGAVLVISVGG